MYTSCMNFCFLKTNCSTIWLCVNEERPVHCRIQPIQSTLKETGLLADLALVCCNSCHKLYNLCLEGGDFSQHNYQRVELFSYLVVNTLWKYTPRLRTAGRLCLKKLFWRVYILILAFPEKPKDKICSRIALQQGRCKGTVLLSKSFIWRLFRKK